MQTISMAQSVLIDAPAARVFAAARGADPVTVFLAHGPLPGIARVEGQTAAWSATGQTRLLTLTDGATLREHLTDFVDAQRFAYRASDFTGPLAALASHADGTWRVINEGAKARLEWRYAFAPKSRAAALILRVIAAAVWPGYMRAALRRIKHIAEDAA